MACCPFLHVQKGLGRGRGIIGIFSKVLVRPNSTLSESWCQTLNPKALFECCQVFTFDGAPLIGLESAKNYIHDADAF